MEALEPGPAPDPALVALGRSLMFDRELSGNRDISCATCHHPGRNTGDALALAIGTGGIGAGGTRQLGPGRVFVARGSPDLFNRGDPRFRALFWDGRVQLDGTGALHTPAGSKLPPGLDGPLAAQALFPVLSRTEMRGEPGDLDVLGSANELALIPDDDLEGIWAGLMSRLLGIPGYATLFAAAYPAVPDSALRFAHAANAIAAFEAQTWRAADTPFDRYLRGSDEAMPIPARRGGILFYGRAGCSACHVGSLLTDQQFWNIGVPQVGPGGGTEPPLDLGRAEVTGQAGERFAFRTPSLRNTELTGPWMHDGVYATLEAAVRHYIDVPGALRNYDPTQLPAGLQAMHHDDEATIAAVLLTLDPRFLERVELDDDEVGDLVAFLRALTDPATRERLADVPASVPSGLPVDP